jgi:hypothetical protein
MNTLTAVCVCGAPGATEERPGYVARPYGAHTSPTSSRRRWGRAWCPRRATYKAMNTTAQSPKCASVKPTGTARSLGDLAGVHRIPTTAVKAAGAALRLLRLDSATLRTGRIDSHGLPAGLAQR